MVYITSDTHFAHKNILEYENRPFKDLSDMREQLILNWNSVVSEDDIVIHLGDFGMCNKETATMILSRLNGHKILVKGNHDNHSDQWFLDAGFDEVYKWAQTITIAGETVLLTHQPYKIPEEIKNNYKYHLYGHVHGKGNTPRLYPTVALNGACMCVERWDYKPVNLEDVIKLCKNASTHFNEVCQYQVESDKPYPKNS